MRIMDNYVITKLVFVLLCFGWKNLNAQINLAQSVQKIGNDLSKQFDQIASLLNAGVLSQSIRATSQTVDRSNILQKSVTLTQTIVQSTNAIINNTQAYLTRAYVNYSQTPPLDYLLDCNTNTTPFVYYFQAKNLYINNSIVLNTCVQKQLPLAPDPFVNNAPTNRAYSTAHVPTNVYDASREIQGVANWTANMDGLFKLQANVSTVKWQLFCSNTGFFRIYPGVKWMIQTLEVSNEPNLVDFFDCRSEEWYLEATAYPKKMVILVDKSGSMKGRRRIIANHTIYEILSTLDENDYFNIILFTKESIFADNKTSDYLMQATAKNKKYIMERLATTFNPDGIAEYDIGLKDSLRLLSAVKNSSNDTIYNYLLMVISDGSPYNYQSIIEEGSIGLNLRVFTYLVGQGITEGDTVKQMACSNNGYAVEIATLADVKENVQKYLNVVSRKNAIMRNSVNVWTGVHQNQILYADMLDSSQNQSSQNYQWLTTVPSYSTNVSMYNTTQSPVFSTSSMFNVTTVSNVKVILEKNPVIKMFVTSSKAVFDQSNATASLLQGIVLGAVGVDVPVTDFISTAPLWKIGVNAYLFGVTNNGFIIFHPKFRPQYKKFIKYFYRNVDISEVEIEVNQTIQGIYANQTLPSKLRDAIVQINPSTSPLSLTTYQIVDDFKTAFPVSRTYQVQQIAGTPYVFGLAVPNNQQVPTYSSITFDPTIFNANTLNGAFSSLFTTFDDYCSTVFIKAGQSGQVMYNQEICTYNSNVASLMLKSPLCAVKLFSTDSTSLQKCLNYSIYSKELLWNIINEVIDTKNFTAGWISNNGTAFSLGVQQIFSMHHFGLTRYYNYKDLSYEDFIIYHNNSLNDPLYQETLLIATSFNQNNIMTVRPLPNEVIKKGVTLNNVVFTITTPIQNSQSTYAGIVGVQVEQNTFFQNLATNTLCANVSMYNCYVLTSAGLIVYNNLDFKNTGENLKDVDCSLMESLTRNNIFKSEVLFDFQGLCVNQSKLADSFANRLVDPFTMVWRWSIWFIYELMIFVQNFSWSSLFWSFTYQEDNPPYAAQDPYNAIHCALNIAGFQMTNNLTQLVSNSTFTINCSTCSGKYWAASSIGKTNLVLIVLANSNPSCTCDCSYDFGKTRELLKNTSEPIQNASIVYPSFYNYFVNFSKQENTTICSDDAVRSVLPSNRLVILMSILSVLLMYHNI